MSTAAILKLRSDVEQKEEDPFKDGDVIRWKRRYDEGGRVYLYAALRAKGLWFITGPRGNQFGMPYEQLVARHLSVSGVHKIAIAADWKSVNRKPKKRTKLQAERSPRGKHEKFCRWSGVSYSEIPMTDGDCACLPVSVQNEEYRQAGIGFDESVHG